MPENAPRHTHEWASVVKRRLAARGIDPTLHFTVVEELAQHLDERYRSLIARGISTSAAERSVIDELDDDALEGELRRAESALRAPAPVLGTAPREGRIDGMLQDLRYAARALRKSPGFTTVAVITLALGVGANTAIFSVLNAVMLRPLPYADSGDLVRIWESNPERGWPTFSASHPNFLDWRAQATSWEAIAATTGAGFVMTSSGGAQLIRAAAVTADFLPAIGVAPVRGRNFRPEEDRPGGDTAVAILTDGFWRRTLGGDPAVLGRTISLNASPYAVVGVLPAGFQWGADLDLLVPLAPDPSRSRGDHRLTVIGRLKPGTSLDQASEELRGIAGNLARQYPESNRGWSVRLATFYDWLIPEQIRNSLVMLLAAVALVLLIACGNVANLLLARGASRRKELSIRVALGASRGRIVRQLLLESVLVSLLAAGVALLVALAAVRLLVAYGPSTIPRLDEVSIDLPVLAFAIASAVVAAFLFGLVPALQVSRTRARDALQETTRSATGSVRGQRLRGALTIAEVALSVALLIAAGLLLRSFTRVQQVDPGFDVDDVMTMRMMLPRPSFPTTESMIAFSERLLAEIQALPGITGVATSSGSPLTFAGGTAGEVSVPGVLPRNNEPQSADWRLVSPGFFRTMGIPLKAGRDFLASDRADAAPVTVISEALARRYWPDGDAVGKTIVLRSVGNRPHTVIGVVGDVRTYGLDRDVPATTYVSAFAYGGGNPMGVLWRSATDPASHVPAIRELVHRAAPDIPLYDLNSFETLLSQSFGPRRFNTFVVGTFATVAVALSAIGLFGVMAFLVAQRTREIGVRLALGANRRDVWQLIIGRGLALASIGAVLGVAGAYWLTSLMESLLFGVSTTDPVTFAAVPTAMISVAALACYVPARRATRVDPVIALRVE